nr:hypothetical protein [Pandoravirus massiliensis]
MYGHAFVQQDATTAPPGRLPSPLGFYLSSVVSALDQDLVRQHDATYDDADPGISFATTPWPANDAPASLFALAWPDPPAPGIVLPGAHWSLGGGPYRMTPPPPSIPGAAYGTTWPERVVEIPKGADAPVIVAAHTIEHRGDPNVLRECLIDGGVVPPPTLPPPLKPSTRAAPKRTSTRPRRSSIQ